MNSPCTCRRELATAIYSKCTYMYMYLLLKTIILWMLSINEVFL